MLDLCLLHYLLSSDSEAMTLHKCHHSIQYFSKFSTKRTKLVLCFKGNTSSFGSAIQVLLSDILEYLSSFFNAVVVIEIILFSTLQLIFLLTL